MDQGLSGNENLRWYALRVRSGKEFLVRATLTQLRLESRLPKRKVYRRINRRRTATTPVWVTAMVGYVFVAFAPGPIPWRRINSIHNVLSPVCYVDRDGIRRYAQLPTGWEDELNPECLDPERPINPADIFGPGDEVTFKSGAFTGLKARVVDIQNGEARVLLEMLSATREMRTPALALKKAA